jgi:O-antigen ligase
MRAPVAYGGIAQPAAARVEWWRAAPAPAEENRISIAALMIFTFILIIAPQTFVPALGVFRIALVAGSVAIAAHIVGRLVRHQPVTIRTREMTVAGCLVAWAVVTVPFSYWPGGSVSFLTGLYFKTLAVFWLLGNVVSSVSRLRKVAWGLTLMSAPLALTGINNFLAGAFVTQAPGVKVSVERIVGYDAPLALNPNDLALVLNLTIPLGVALFLLSTSTMRRAVLASVVALAAIAVIFTFSRAGFLTLCSIGAMYCWKLRHRRESRWMWAAVVVALACTPLLPSGYTERITTILDVEADPTGSSQVRWADTKAALRIVARSPVVGAGIGQNILALNEERGPAWKAVHNVYLEYAVELGLPGLTLFLLLLIFSVRSVMFAERRAASIPALRELSYVAEGIQISLLAFAVAGMFHPGGYQFGFYYFAGLATATRAIAESYPA